jgi:AcrR family transcriptional regulator
MLLVWCGGGRVGASRQRILRLRSGRADRSTVDLSITQIAANICRSSHDVKELSTDGPVRHAVHMSRAAYHHGDLRQAILDESRRQIESKGLSAFSVAAVASSLGVSSGAPYHHFRDKHEVRQALAERVYAELLDRVAAATNRALDSGPTDRETVRSAASAACHEFLQFSIDHPVLFEMAVAHYRPSLDSVSFGLGTAMAHDSARLVAAGLIDSTRVEEFGSALYVALRGIAAVADESPRLVAHSTEPHLLLDQMLDALLFAYAPAEQGEESSRDR